ncbi:hypothetical protein cypCar_00029564 [Cyprinus carpio]|nr:hypothetical protein cypCar_00029564 [Cyprinus carpio]
MWAVGPWRFPTVLPQILAFERPVFLNALQCQAHVEQWMTYTRGFLKAD